MKHKLLITSAAAALLAGTVLAAGQGAPRSEGGQGAAPSGQREMQRQEPTQGQNQTQPGQRRGQTQGQREGQRDGQTQGQRQQDRTTGQGPREEGQGQRRDEQRQNQGQRRDGARDQNQRNQTQGQGRRDQDQQGQQGQQGQRSGQQSQQGQRDGSRDQTQGQGVGRGAGAAVTLTTEQRTRIRETVFRGSNVPRVTNINFSINVGTVVPRTVKLVAVPRVIVDIHPEWRGFLYFVYEDEIIIVDSRSHKIVAILEV